jgi:hypothetical protein
VSGLCRGAEEKARVVAMMRAEFELLAACVFLASGLLAGLDTYIALLLGWVSLWRRGLTWRDVGLRLPPRAAVHPAVGLAIGAAWAPFDIFLVEPSLASLFGAPIDLSQFAPIVGNTRNYLILLALVWTLVAVGEEMTYRGYLLNRGADVFGRTAAGWAASVLIVSIVFGVAHRYQGLAGIMTTGYVSLGLGLVYLLAGRNLLVPIAAHAAYDTVGITLVYLDRYPALRAL